MLLLIKPVSHCLYGEDLINDTLLLEIENPKIRVSALGNRLFVLDHLYVSLGILVKILPHKRCVATFTNILREINIYKT